MISKTSIWSNLKTLEHKYNSTTSAKESLFYSKLALLELCGWIEESMDDIVLRDAMRRLRKPQSREYIKKEVVARTYGFDYNKHFKQMLVRLIGATGLEKLERRANSQQLLLLKGTLGSLKAVRDAEAHTHLKGLTKRIDSPSVTIRHFFNVYNGLLEVQNKLRIVRL